MCRFCMISCCIVAALANYGCSDAGSGIELAPVKGKVSFLGKPVAGAVVSFMKDDAPRAAVGETDAEGNYQLTMFDKGDGAVLGQNTVTITSSTPPAPPITNAEEYAKVMIGSKKSPQENKGYIPEKYADPKRGLLKVNVKEGANEHDFKLQE